MGGGGAAITNCGKHSWKGLGTCPFCKREQKDKAEEHKELKKLGNKICQYCGEEL